MAKQTLGLGTSANDNTGDTLRVGGDKVNDNFNEIYAALGNGTTLTVDTTNPAVGQVLRYNGATFLPSDYTNLTAALDVNGNSIISSSNGNIPIATNGTGDITLAAGGITSTFDGATGTVDFPTSISYKNEYNALGSAPAAATYTGYYFTVNGDDNPYVNINITAGGVGDTRAKLLTEYSSVNLLTDIDTTTTPPTNGQVLKWNTANSKWLPGDDSAGIGSINVFASVAGDTGSTTANSQTDTLTIAGGSNITTAVVGDTVTVNFSGTLTTTLAALTDTNTSGLTQGDMLYWSGSEWIPTPTSGPIIWYEVGAPVENSSTDFLINGPGLPAGENRDPTLYLHRGFTYAFDNSVEGGGHPFRIQSTQGLSGTPYTTGQTGSITAVLYWTVPFDAPSTLYYQCTLHAAMQGTINIVS
tara:strand:+ start:53 stop:1297 length:1245 start_codon:yes stop_codon:yes gene_type:complete